MRGFVVTISGKDGENFKGFIAGARRLSGDTEDIVGSITEMDSTTSRGAFWYGEDATGNTPNCITHATSSNKERVTFTWKAPSRSVGDIHFVSPIVQQFNHFWVNVTSSVLSAEVPSEEPPYTNVVHNMRPPENDTVQGRCGEEIGCIMTPSLCSIESNCDVYVKYKLLDNSQLKLELSAKDAHFLTIGFSNDTTMGDDLTVTCTAAKATYTIQTGYNSQSILFWNERHRTTQISGKYVQSPSDNNGRLWCQFTMPVSQSLTTIHGLETIPATLKSRRFDLNDPHYTFIAYGEVIDGTTSISKHRVRPSKTNTMVNFMKPEIHYAHRIDAYVKAHGSIMLLAWLGFGAIGMSIAEYFKRFYTKKIGGVMLWFHLHRLFVISAFLLSIIGVVIIFAKLNWQWKNTSTVTTVHGALGLTVVGLATMQIIMGLLRPAVDSQRRPIFNILHRIGGYSAMAFSDATYFLAGSLLILPQSYRIAHIVIVALWVVYRAVFLTTFGIMSGRYNSRIKDSDAKGFDNTALKRHFQSQMLKIFIGFVIGQLVFFLFVMSLLLVY